MQTIYKLISVFFVIFFFVTPVSAEGSARCEKGVISTSQIVSAGKQAARLLMELEELNAQVAVVGRVGSDISGKGLKYTHAGIAWKNKSTGKWQFTHMLNHCGKSTAAIYNEGLLNFYLEDPFSYDTSVLTFEVNFEYVMHKQLENNAYLAFADRNYSMISYPFSTKFINSNQFILEAMSNAEAELEGITISSREGAQAYLRKNGYKGTQIRIYFLESLFGALFKENISFSDHPTEERESGEFRFVSVRSLGEYAGHRGFLSKSFEIPGMTASLSR